MNDKLNAVVGDVPVGLRHTADDRLASTGSRQRPGAPAVLDFIYALVCWICCAVLCHADEPTMRFSLADGSTAEGSLTAAEAAGTVRISNPRFAQPIALSTDHLLEARRQSMESDIATDSERDQRAKRFAIELNDRSRYVGVLVSWQDDLITMETEAVGRVSFAAERVVRIMDVDTMPDQIASLADSRYRYRREAGWEFTDRGLSGTTPDAATVADLELPDRFRIRIDVTCQGIADFELILGDRSTGGAGQGGGRIDRRGGSLSRLPTETFVTRLEWFDNSVSLVRSNASVSDAAVFDVTDASDRLTLDLYVDQASGRLLAYHQGVKRGQVSLVDDQPVLRRELTLINRGDPVQLTQFELLQWDGRVPESRLLPDRYTLLDDGAIVQQVVREWDADRFRVGDTWHPMEDLAWMEFGVATVAAVGSEFVLRDGCRLRGEVQGRDSAGAIVLRDSTGVRLAVDPSFVVRCVGRADDVIKPAEDASRLLADGSGLWGRLIDGAGVAATFGWRVALAENDVGIAADEGVTIEFASPSEVTADVELPTKSKTGMLQLRSGDRLPGQLISIQSDGVRFRSAVCDEIRVPLNAVSRVDAGPAVELDPSDLPWLTSLPRRMVDAPPTHVLVSPDGDALRGRLLSLDQQDVRIEVRDRTRLIDRASVAAVIWLDQAENGAEQKTPSCRYVVTTRDGARLGLQTASFDGHVLQGTHPQFGNCRIPVGSLERLSFGSKETSWRESLELVPVKQPKTFQ
ncbi:hypothetical protein Mal15_07400 [Stieleria maiorica]|uniref:SLA1 homology domain-containing protein n=1 Tax=Stieleria maiorica TaxID=2795974 RepID=A0A5B9M6J5_9BACT|nr:hypothetical protein [Stieleria maiorica]QEF96712.1 hypothetical protein Mal15_07400 [Stieleria maiorica]